MTFHIDGISKEAFLIVFLEIIYDHFEYLHYSN